MTGAAIEHSDLETLVVGCCGVIAAAQRIADLDGPDRTGTQDVCDLVQAEYLLDKLHQLASTMRQQVTDDLAAWDLRMTEGQP